MEFVIFTPAIDEMLVFERDEFSTNWLSLQKRFNIPSDDLKKRYAFLIAEEIAKDKAKYAGETTCLTCRKKFMSEHRVNIRFCDPCRNKNKELANNMVENATFGT